MRLMWKLSETVHDKKAMILYIYYAHLEEMPPIAKIY